jgi:hypothetical protein
MDPATRACASAVWLDSGDVHAFVPPDTILQRRAGRISRQIIVPPRAACAGPDGVAVLDSDGRVSLHGASIEPRWRHAALSDTGPWAVSGDGAWVFDGADLVSETATVAPFSVDFFSRWTFARFLPGGLVLGFESSQPYSQYGSYGNPHAGIQLEALPSASATGTTLIGFDYGYLGKGVAPDDIAWHSRGVVATLVGGELTVKVLDRPRGVVGYDLLPHPDDHVCGATSFFCYPHAARLALDASGRWLAAHGEETLALYDLGTWREATLDLHASAVALRTDAALVVRAGGCDEIRFDLLDWRPLEAEAEHQPGRG